MLISSSKIGTLGLVSVQVTIKASLLGFAGATNGTTIRWYTDPPLPANEHVLPLHEGPVVMVVEPIWIVMEGVLNVATAELRP